MKTNMKVVMSIGGFLALVTLNGVAETVSKNLYSMNIKNEIVSKVLDRASKSEKGVIMVVSDSGEKAETAAILLSEQVQYNKGYLPLLMVPNDRRPNIYLYEFGLAKQDLPAVIIFNKAGAEIGRIVAVKGKNVL
jgi:hypothetical protein